MFELNLYSCLSIMESNHFENMYADWPTEKLAEIIQSSADYQVQAVEAAHKILKRRNVSASEIEQIIDNAQKKPDVFTQKINPLIARLFLFSAESKAVAYVINSISAVLLLQYFLSNYSMLNSLYYVVSAGIPVDFKEIAFYLFMISRFAFILLFWQRSIVGWIYVCSWAVYEFVYTSLHWYYLIIESTDTEFQKLLFPDESGGYFVFWWLYFGFALYLINMPYIRARYQSSVILLIVCIIIGVALNWNYIT